MQGTGGQRGWQWSGSGAMTEAPAPGSGEAEGGLKSALAGESVCRYPRLKCSQPTSKEVRGPGAWRA